MSRGKFALGNDRYVQVLEWRGEVKGDFREWESKNDSIIPSKKGIRLGMMQYKNLLTSLENVVGPALSENKDDKFHVGANVFLSVKKEKPMYGFATVLETSQSPWEYEVLKSLLSEIETLIPELENVFPCYLMDDHLNQLGMLEYRYCNPDEYMNWWIDWKNIQVPLFSLVI